MLDIATVMLTELVFIISMTSYSYQSVNHWIYLYLTNVEANRNALEMTESCLTCVTYSLINIALRRRQLMR